MFSYVIFQTYKVVGSSRSNYIEHVNVLHERGQKHKADSYKGKWSSSLLFSGYTRIQSRFLCYLIRPSSSKSVSTFCDLEQRLSWSNVGNGLHVQAAILACDQAAVSLEERS